MTKTARALQLQADGVSRDGIAAALGCSVGSVDSLLFKARHPAGAQAHNAESVAAWRAANPERVRQAAVERRYRGKLRACGIEAEAQ